MFSFSKWDVSWLLLLVVLLAVYYNWTKTRLYVLSNQFRGALALPFVGNSYVFIGNHDDFLNKFMKYFHQFKGNDPIKFWFGPYLLICFVDPNHIENILCSQKYSQKMEIYDMLRTYIGEGLITASGPAYRQHKKAIQPLLSTKFVENSVRNMYEYTDQCIEEMKNLCNNGTFDTEEIIHKCFTRMLTKTILGKDLDVKETDDLIKLSGKLYYFFIRRISTPWLYTDYFYEMSALYRMEVTAAKEVYVFLKKIYNSSKARVASGNVENQNMKPLVDSLVEIVNENPDIMTEKLIFDHIWTLFLASEDTVTLTMSFLCVCLGMYPEYQKKLAEELRNHFGDTPRNATMQDVSQLPYLTMCIKETLRVLPIAPIILRKALEESEIGDWKIPKGASLLLPVHLLHRKPEFWKNPDHFYPDHFLPEAQETRPQYVYLPFSSGSRGCIGKHLAMSIMKVFMANLLQRFEIEADGKLPDVKLRMDISARPIEGFKIRLRERIW